jgi:cAMP-dependent protein kinase regulator
MGDIFYMIEEGEAEATKTFEPGKPPVVVKNYRSGDYFGELALIEGEPRAANIIAKVNIINIYLIILERVKVTLFG